MLKLTEAQLKYAAEQYLAIGENLGLWTWDHLNTGSFVMTGEKGRRIRGCRPGTADLMVWKKERGFHNLDIICRLIFLELKSKTGKQRDSQKEFQVRAVSHGAEYYIIKSTEELERLLPMG